MGMVGNWGAMPPASKRMTRSGACVRWASMAAAQGTPVPTATVRPFSSCRAAQQIISSIALKVIAAPHTTRCCYLLSASLVLSSLKQPPDEEEERREVPDSGDPDDSDSLREELERISVGVE